MTPSEEYAERIEHWLNTVPPKIREKMDASDEAIDATIEAARLVAARLAETWVSYRIDEVTNSGDDVPDIWLKVRGLVQMADHPGTPFEDHVHKRFTAYLLALKAYQEAH